MSNKYQEALNFIFGFALDGSLNDDESNLVRDKAKILQELVDKATPMKPTVKELKRPDGKGGEEFWQYLYKCPTCEENYKKNRFINHFNSLDKGIPYCKHCGTKVDWSDDND